MKNITSLTQTLLFAGALLFSISGFARKASYYTLSNTAKKTAMTLDQIPLGSFISIVDTQGNILYQKTNSYSKGFDVSFLDNGSYYFQIQNMKASRIPFRVTKNLIFFNKEEDRNKAKINGSIYHLSQLYEGRHNRIHYKEVAKKTKQLFK
ncbi:hypothetical protein F6U93_13545 [Tamlana haliotis]|uniref:Uncharacterized protein n=1 Tax=Pseudotamlana haliotis TaxID=2614804 RepID=A0A6N6M8Y4_9FLAO|nr:hypothetical protein [Tamlana haliotis]KAB1066872.1 hypothetical protein F6U93_13545 [Tamlana haliotis]